MEPTNKIQPVKKLKKGLALASPETRQRVARLGGLARHGGTKKSRG